MYVAVIPDARTHTQAARAHEPRGRGPVLSATSIGAVSSPGQLAVVDHGVRVIASGAIDDDGAFDLAEVGHLRVSDALEPAGGTLPVVFSQT